MHLLNTSSVKLFFTRAMELELLIRCLVYAALAWVSSFIILTAIKRSKFNPKRQPPGPFPLPLVGNLFSLGSQPLKALSALAKPYGPVMTLHLGWQITVVVSSASMAKEVLHTNDVYYGNRFVPDAMTATDHHKYSVAGRPADARWKMYRKICTSHVFASSRLDATLPLRNLKIQDLLSFVQTSSITGTSVNIGQAAFATTLNLLSNTFFSIDLGDPNSEIAREYNLLIKKVELEFGTSNLADCFPVLKTLDPQHIRKRMTSNLEKLMTLFDNMISDRLEERNCSDSVNWKNDVLDALLTLAQESKDLQLLELRHLMLDLFIAGTETTSTSLEWAMSELMCNPEKMMIAQAELEHVIGKGNLMEEQDLIRLPYLQSVVKEALRMHPPLPFLLPRMVYQDTPLGEFTVPKNAQILVNVNSIQRDPNLWKNPDSFHPERFLGSSVDFKGRSFELLPFGSGKRICPGIPLANKMVHWMLGSLIHTFEWRLEGGVTPETLDMEDKIGITLDKAKPLHVIPVRK